MSTENSNSLSYQVIMELLCGEDDFSVEELRTIQHTVNLKETELLLDEEKHKTVQME